MTPVKTRPRYRCAFYHHSNVSRFRTTEAFLSKIMTTVKPGQIWQHKDGRKVRIAIVGDIEIVARNVASGRLSTYKPEAFSPLAREKRWTLVEDVDGTH